jgi:hypothetical protein
MALQTGCPQKEAIDGIPVLWLKAGIKAIDRE